MQRRNVKRIRDLQEFTTVVSESGYFDNWKQEELENLVSSKNYLCLSVAINNEIAGFVVLSSVIDTAEIIYIYINKDFRKKGIGMFLLTKALDALREESVSQVFLEVADNNDPARKLYEKLGYKQIGKRKKYYKNKIDAIIYRLDL